MMTTPTPFNRPPWWVRVQESPVGAIVWFLLILALCLVAGADWAGR